MTNPVDRREAIKRLGAAGLAVAGAAAGAVWLHGRPGWPRPTHKTILPSYAAGGDDGPRMVIARGRDPAALVEAALGESGMGGIERFIEPGDVVLVKPNAAFGRPVWQGATTHPAVLGAVVAACRRAGASEVRVTDNPIHAPAECFRKSELGRAAREAGAKVILPYPSGFSAVALEGTLLDGWPLLLGPLEGVTKVIGIAPVKDHNLARASLTMKNWYGLLGGKRNLLHQRMDETIATLGQLIRPTLVVLDGVRIMVRNGPTGGSPKDVVPGDLIAVSTDTVAADAFGATLLDLDPSELPYLAMAEARGAGTVDFRSLDPREVEA